MGVRSAFILLIVPLATATGGCSSDSTSGPTSTPQGCENTTAAPAENGFFLTDSTNAHVAVVLDSAIMASSAVSNGLADRTDYSIATGPVVVGADTIPFTMVVSFSGLHAGSQYWDNVAQGTGFRGVTLGIGEGPNAGTYRAISGKTTVTTFYDVDSLSFAGSFCGTLRDSLNRIITLEGGRLRFT